MQRADREEEKTKVYAAVEARSVPRRPTVRNCLRQVRGIQQSEVQQDRGALSQLHVAVQAAARQFRVQGDAQFPQRYRARPVQPRQRAQLDVRRRRQRHGAHGRAHRLP